MAARLRWRKQRALKVYRHWRQSGSPAVPGTAEPAPDPELFVRLLAALQEKLDPTAES